MSRAFGIPIASLGVLAGGLALLGTLTMERETPAIAREVPGDVVTLFAHDQERAAFDFDSGNYGGRLEGGEVVLDSADLAFHVFGEGLMSFGFVERTMVNVVDLGELRVPPRAAASDRSPRPDISIYYTLFLERDELRYVDATGRSRRALSAEVAFGSTLQEGLRHVTPIAGHVYVLGMKASGQASRREIYIKLLVLDVEPGRTLTFRWARLG